MIDGLFSGANYQWAKKALDVTAAKHRALASNIANAETPGFRRVDLQPGFDTQLTRLARRGDWDKVRDLKVETGPDLQAVSQRADGNTVELEKELLGLNRNAMNYEFSADMVSSSIKQLKFAITGRNPG